MYNVPTSLFVIEVGIGCKVKFNEAIWPIADTNLNDLFMQASIFLVQ